MSPAVDSRPPDGLGTDFARGVDHQAARWNERALVIGLLIRDRDSRPLIAGGDKRGVRHSERLKDPLGQEFFVRLAGRNLDDPAAHIQARTVLPFRARLKIERPCREHIRRRLERRFAR